MFIKSPLNLVWIWFFCVGTRSQNRVLISTFAVLPPFRFFALPPSTLSPFRVSFLYLCPSLGFGPVPPTREPFQSHFCVSHIAIAEKRLEPPATTPCRHNNKHQPKNRLKLNENARSILNVCVEKNAPCYKATLWSHVNFRRIFV